MWHVDWHTSLINAHQVILALSIFMAFERPMCYWHILCNSMVNKCCSLLPIDKYEQ